MDAPHGTDGRQRKNDRVHHLIHDAVGQLRHDGVGLKAGGEPTVNQIEGHGDKQQDYSQRIHKRTAGPHDGDGTQHSPKDEGWTGIDKQRREAFGYVMSCGHYVFGNDNR